MKHLLFAAALTLSTTFSFATPNDVNKDIKNSFTHEFKNAKIMSTEVKDNFTKVMFQMNGMIMTAFYSNKAELMAVTRNIVSTQLPLNLLMSLKNDYSGFWISDLFEINNDAQTTYYVTIENSDYKTTLRSSVSGWEVYANVRK